MVDNHIRPQLHLFAIFDLKRCGICYQHLPHSAFDKRFASPDGLSATCRICHSAYQVTRRTEKHDYVRKLEKASYEKNKEKNIASVKRWQAANPEKVVESKVACYLRHKEKYIQAARNHYAANREHCLEVSRAYSKTNPQSGRKAKKAWKLKNPEQVAADRAQRRAAKFNATPSWVDQRKITKIYADCIKLSRETGIQHHVDHIVPLRGKTVCGLHVHTNLRIVPASVNYEKRAKWTPEIAEQLLETLT